MIDRKIADFLGAKDEEKGETGNQDEDDDEELPPIISAKQEREAGGIFLLFLEQQKEVNHGYLSSVRQASRSVVREETKKQTTLDYFFTK